jgi:citrate lyase subunit beta/citryl-CoA lyase
MSVEFEPADPNNGASMSSFRSFLFTPANHVRHAEKVFTIGADVAILDLEDAVAVNEKKEARNKAAEALQRPRCCQAYVRVNAMDTEFCLDDLEGVVGPALDGVMLPKVESAASLLAADWILTQLERRAGITIGSIDLLPIIETGAGLMALEEIAKCGSRIRRLAFGAGDFTFDMNMIWTSDERELDYARSRLVALSRATGLEAPIDTIWVDIPNLDGLRASAETALQMGFQGKLCIHPTQVPVVNDAFTPSDEAVAYARKVVDAFTEAEAAGSAALLVDGKFIDYPFVYRAQRTLKMVKDMA